jgi:PST family polysaccharide transporter
MRLVFKNLFSLGLVQGITLLAPLILTPYVISSVGIDKFGIITTAQTVATLITLLTDFGFNITAVRQIAQAEGNHAEIQRIVNVVFFLKLLLLIAAFILFIAVVLLAPQFRANFFIYLCSVMLVIGQTFLPVWY